MNLCGGVLCTTPPAATCVGATVRRTYAPSGQCNQGVCDYSFADATCAFGCSGGSCAPDLCQGVSCLTPPASGCLDASTRRVYAPTGSCGAGQCAYSFVDTLCANGCANGLCSGPTCAGTSCGNGPAPSCTSATVLRTSAQLGSCDAGACVYSSWTTACTQGCFGGACITGSWESLNIQAVGGARLIYDGAAFPHILACSAGDVVHRFLTAAGWVEELVDDNVGAGGACEADFAFEPNGTLAAAWYDAINDDLRFGRRVNGAWQNELVATAGDVGVGVTVIVSPASVTQVLANANNELRLFTKSGNSWVAELIGPSAGDAISAAYAADSALHVANGVSTLWTGPQANQPPVFLSTKRSAAWSRQVVNDDGAMGRNALSVGSDGVLRIAFRMSRGGQGNGVVRSYLPDGPVDVLATGIGGDSSDPAPLLRATGREGWTLIPNSGPLWQRAVNGVWEPLGIAERPPFSTFTPVHDVALAPDGTPRFLSTLALITAPACVPACGSATCGDDGCGGSCGVCSNGLRCALDGTCTDWNVESLESGGSSTNMMALAENGQLSAFWTAGTRAFWAKRQPNGWWRAGAVPVFLFAGQAAARPDGSSCVADGYAGSRAMWCEDSTADGGWSVASPPNAFSPTLLTMSRTGRAAMVGTGANQTWGRPRWGVISELVNGQWVGGGTYLSVGDDAISPPSAAYDDADVLHAVYVRNADVPDAGRLEYVTRADGGDTISTIRVASLRSQTSPSLRVDDLNRPHVVVIDHAGLTYGVKTGGAWTFEPVVSAGARLLPPTQFSGRTFAFAVSPAGLPVLLLEGVVYRRTGPSQWSSEPLPLRAQQSSGALEVDRSGAVHVVVLDTGRMLHVWK